MADVIVFPLKLRSPDADDRNHQSEVVPFPYGRRRNLVERHARAMRAMRPDQAEAYLNRVLDGICSDLRKIGIDCEDCECDAMLEFVGAIGRQLHGPNFVLEPEEISR